MRAPQVAAVNVDINLVHGTVDGKPLAMPRFGLGTYKLKENVCFEAVKVAVAKGYRLVDTAFVYNNERFVGKALEETASQGRVFVITKFWRAHYSFDKASIEATLHNHLEQLSTPIDLWLIHWPGPGRHPHTQAPKPADWSPAMREVTWTFMCSHLGEKVRAVGVSNFSQRQMERLHAASGIWPAANEFEVHPLCQRRPLVEFCQKQGIAVIAYGSVGSRDQKALLLESEEVTSISRRIGRSGALVLLRWAWQKGFILIPGSSNPNHIEENASVNQFELSNQDMMLLDQMEERHGTHVMGWKGALDLDSVDIPETARGDTWEPLNKL